jgi:hypothetical protein
MRRPIYIGQPINDNPDEHRRWSKVAFSEIENVSYEDASASPVADFYSGLMVTEKTTSGNYDMVAADDVILVNKSVGAATTVNLVTAAGRSNRPVKVVDGKGDAATNNITIDGSGAETIVGAATYVIAFNYGSVTLWPKPDGSGWYI